MIVSILLTIGVFARGSKNFQAFSTVWTAVSLVPIVAVLAAYRWRLVLPRKLIVASVLGYVVALAVPAMGDDNDTTFGLQAAYMSFFGLEYLWAPEVCGNMLIGGVPVPAPFLTITIDKSTAIACALGAAANVAYLASIVGCWLGRKRPRALRFACRAATVASILAIPSLVVPCIDTGPDTFYPGCGLWIASFLALSLGTRQVARGLL